MYVVATHSRDDSFTDVPTSRRSPIVRRLLWVAAAVVGLPIAAILLFIVYIVGWFNAGIFYSGDGVYRRNAGEVAFQVQFSPVDLTRAGRYEYRFTRLGPEMNYVVGLRILDERRNPLRMDEYGRPDLLETERPTATVLMQLSNEREQVVFRHSRPLQDWNWLRNMAEINGEITEIPVGGGSVRIQPLGVGPDGGWGTHFEPRYFGTYTLTVTVEQRSTSAERQIVYPVIEAYMAWP